MNELNWQKLVAGAVSGLLSAILIDVHAWSKSGEDNPFDWGLAAKRWVGGILAGVMGALGYEGVQ